MTPSTLCGDWSPEPISSKYIIPNERLGLLGITLLQMHLGYPEPKFLHAADVSS